MIKQLNISLFSLNDSIKYIIKYTNTQKHKMEKKTNN